MKKLLFLAMPLIMAGVMTATNKGVEANYADFGPVTIRDIDDYTRPPYVVDKPKISIGDLIKPKQRTENYDDEDIENMPEGGELTAPYGNFTDITTQSSYLGYGYNVITSPYMEKDYVRIQNPIMDMDLIKTCPLTIIKENITRYKQYMGQSMEEFMEDYGASVSVYGNYGKVFSGGIKAEYKGSQSEKKLYYFCKTQYLKRSFNIYLGGGASALKSKLSSQFQHDLSYMTPAQLFHNYGTHMIAEVTMGGRLEMNTTYSSETTDYTNEAMAAINAHVKYLGSSINGEASANYSNALTAQNITERTEVNVLGGASYNLTSPEAVKDNIGSWLLSFDQDLSYSAMMGIVGDQSLIPLWDLVDDDDPERKAELEDYFVEAAGDAYEDLCNTFKLNKKRYVSVTVNGGGTIQGNNSPYQRGDTVSLSAVPNYGYAFDGWYQGTQKVSSSSTYSFSITFDTNLTAKFVAVNLPPDGTPERPYQIRSASDFRNIRYKAADACYELLSDINLNNELWEPIAFTYKGQIKGNGHTISNLKISKTSGLGSGCYFVGLFSQLGDGARISNLTIKNSSLTYSQSSNESPLVYGGLICGLLGLNSIVENCNFINTTASVQVYFSLVGTVAGYVRGTIRSCRCEYTYVYGYDVVGGFAGTLDYDATAENCVITKNSSGTKSYITLYASPKQGGSCRAGGIAGYAFESVVKNCTVEYTAFKLANSANNKPCMGYVVGHACYAYITNSTVYTNTISKQCSCSYNTNFFPTTYNGKVGKKEGTCTIS